ncbi:competence protein ComEA [Gordonibacter sp. An230]|uniref:helix-hairpin-helix domain-containing protein n=1 Tax=Gordonibacter sp. An230 TaxID=1965592 RepID=UPI000B3A181A|nr:helix-hairpin-helix domain-containing protein [Gordonibacter sp. An230]OUO91521.1 competence protein ComEA [Gordonibacter sp. An230]
MSFTEEAESWRSKAHLGGARLPVLVGVTAIAALVLVFAGKALFDAASADAFVVEREGQEQAEGAQAEGEGEGAGEARTVVVHVGGAVAEPGVRELAEGSRVQDAVEASGGFAEGAASDALNLARVLADGEQVVVPTLEEVAGSQDGGSSTTEAGSSPGAASGGKVNINRASVAELDELPGVGPSTAEKIVADREANGPFSTIEDLKRVSGIGDKKYEDLADLVCVG